MKSTDPERTTEEAEAMGIKDLLATFSDSYGGTANRQHNVRITTEYASNVFLAPGEVYNFDQQIGPGTAARGYKTAPGIVGPGKLEDVFGGGICEVSTALFNAVFFAGLEVIERKNHSIFIDHYPKGRDATVSAGGPNLRFRNDTSHYIWTEESRTESPPPSTSTAPLRAARSPIPQRLLQLRVADHGDHPHSQPPGGTAGGKDQRSVGQTVLGCADGHFSRRQSDPQGQFISTYPMVPQQIEVGTGSTPRRRSRAPPPRRRAMAVRARRHDHGAAHDIAAQQQFLGRDVQRLASGGLAA